MFRSFWFYFNVIPFVFGLIILFTPILNLFPLNPPKITNAVEYCSDVVNEDVYSTEHGTYQDFCIAKFMEEPENLKIIFKFFSLIGLLFIFTLGLFFLLRLQKLRNKINYT